MFGEDCPEDDLQDLVQSEARPEAEVGPKEIERLHEVELVRRCLHNSHVLLEMQTQKAEIYFLRMCSFRCMVLTKKIEK